MTDPSAGAIAAPDLSSETPAQLRTAITVQILRAVARGLDVVEGVLARLDPSAKDAERTTRTLAEVCRTLHETAALTRPDDPERRDDPDDDPIPDDIDEFRRELARRIRGIVEAERGRTGSGLGGSAEEGAAALD